MANRPDVLIEHWFPVETIGAESMRERGASSALPPLYFLHVWWARRPLLASRAAILGSVLPVWRSDWPAKLQKQFPTEADYHKWFLRLCGIFGDPVQGRKLIQYAKDRNIKLKVPPYSHKRAFTISPAPELLDTMGDLLEQTWGTRHLSVLDSFAGGGSIPFEARRYGFETYANELNPVASVILAATLNFPFEFGPSLASDIAKYGARVAELVKERLARFFPVPHGESVHAYLWTRTVVCPYTGKSIPLSPNWWVQKVKDQEDRNVAVIPQFEADADRATFKVFVGEHAVRAGAAKGTVKGGNAISPWAANQPVDGDLIKQQAKDGRLGQQLYAVVVKTSAGFGYRPPNAAELDALEVADAELARILPGWDAKDIIPNERITSVSNYDRGHRLYGMEHWREFFAPRQLLAHGTIVECLNVVAHQVRKELEPDRAKAVATYLRLGADKALDYDSRLTRWDSTRLKIVNGFDKHGYKFLWSHPEFEAARNLIPWCMDQVADAYIGMAKLANPDGGYQVASKAPKLAPLHQIFGSAASIESVPSGSVNLVCTDPPYHDNVMYAECSDFFYVWLRRNLSGLYPSFFESDETNKDEEAVANVARFASVGKRKKELATSDYERKMASAFREIYRVLQPTGTLSVMFTHKKVEAWDTLATSLIGAGFSIKSSWPVHTESEHSTHQAKKNAAQSTIMLTCRKRDTGGDPVWWDDLKGKVRKVARDTAIQLEKQGIRGVDLYIATFGPTLAILSDSWPVLTSEVDDKGNPKPLRPEVALDLARAEVVALRKQDLLLGRTVQFDKATDWYLMAWDAFAAAEFPADEARKLALALDLDLERDVIAQKRLVTKKQSTVVLQEPGARRKRDMVDPDKTSFDCWIDAVHTAMLLYSEDGANACQRFLRVSGLMTDSTFKALVQALLNVIPRTRIKGKFVRPEAEVLEAMRLSFFDDLTVPVEEEVKLPDRQGSLFSGAEVAEDAPGVDEDGEDAEDEEDEE